MKIPCNYHDASARIKLPDQSTLFRRGELTHVELVYHQHTELMVSSDTSLVVEENTNVNSFAKLTREQHWS